MRESSFGLHALFLFGDNATGKFIGSISTMQRHRFFASRSQISESSIALDAEESHHLSRVLRLSEGERVFVFDGDGLEWECEIASAGKRESSLTIIRQLDDQIESTLDLTLAQALIKGDKFDWVVQKATELGVTRIVPLMTEHSDIRKAEERAENRLTRWRRISLEALKQCGRRRLVKISEPISFHDFCEMNETANSLIFSEHGGNALTETAKRLRQASQLNLCIGSEGGWSERELSKAETHNFIPVHLGNRILRTETAAIATVVLAQYLFGDLH